MDDIKLGETKEIEFNSGKIHIWKLLDDNEVHQLLDVLGHYKKVFTFDKKSIVKCNMTEFSVQLIDESPIHMTLYRYSLAQRQEKQKQVAELLELGIISHSRNPYALPVVLAVKSNRLKDVC